MDVGHRIADSANLTEFCEARAQLQALEWLETADWEDICPPEEPEEDNGRSEEY